jgi:glyoxylase-like metal-dependent hydrolase (beta-lactamase superfamily II)
MNMICRLTIITFLIYLIAFSFCGCNTHGDTSVDNESQKIDSLIEIQKINDKCILVKFGADAITAINTKKGIVVVDAGISSELTARYRRIIEKKFTGDDFTYVINSHGHPDHYGGNSIFKEALIIGHTNCLQEISEQRNYPGKRIKNLSKVVEDYDLHLKASEPNTREWNEIFTQKTRYLNACNDAKKQIPVKQPDITFSDSLNIDMGDSTLEMIYFGKCHSKSDILIYVPEMNILFVGDLFSEFGRPDINDSLKADKDRWRQAVQWNEKRMNNTEKIINGHGQILTIDDLKSFNSNILSRCSKNKI